MSVKRNVITLRRLRPLTVLLVLALACSGAGALTSRAAPDGIIVGKWLLSPKVFVGVEYDSNIFRRSVNIQSDWIQRTTLGLAATVPVRNSAFLFEYTADRYAYQNFDLARDWSQFGRAAWRWNLASSDTITLSTSYTKGITNIQDIDPGGELTFRGQPYNLARYDLQAERAVPRQQGYLIKVSRIDLNWEPEEDDVVGFFDYRGYDARYEYRQPVSVIDWFIVYAEMRRFNHYRARGYKEWDPDANNGQGAYVDAWQLGVPFRKEESGSLQVGVRGFLGRGQPFFARIGYGEFQYTGTEASKSKFKGIVGQLDWSLHVGARSMLGLTALRRPLPSSFPTYYIVDEFRINLERPWRQYSDMGFNVLLSKNTYGDVLDPIPPSELPPCGDQIRVDNRWNAEAYMNWLIHGKFGFRFVAGHYERTSNCPGADYKANIVTTGLTMGWF